MLHFETDVETLSKAASFASATSKGAGGESSAADWTESVVLLSGTPEGLVVRCTTRAYQASITIDPDKVVHHVYGDCMVSVSELAKFLDSNPMASQVEVLHDGAVLRLKVEEVEAVCNLEAFHPEHAMPEWRLSEEAVAAIVPLDFTEQLKFAAKFACTDPSRSFYGINVDSEGIIALDGFTFAKISHPMADFPSTTLDPRVVRFLAAPKDFGDGDIVFASDGDKFQVRFGTSILTGPTIGNDFAPARAMVEDQIIAPYVSGRERYIVWDYQKFGATLGRIVSRSIDNFDRVIISPTGQFVIGDRRVSNYTERIPPLESTISHTFALSLGSLLKIYKEGKDEKLTLICHPTSPDPGAKQVLVGVGNRVVGVSPIAYEEGEPDIEGIESAPTEGEIMPEAGSDDNTPNMEEVEEW